MTKKERSKLMKKMWQNPGYRKHMSEIHKGQHSSPKTEFKKGYKAWNEGLIGYNRGIKNHSWKGGRIIDSRGYVFLKCYNHPFSHNYYVSEHRLIVERQIGRYLRLKERVHHLGIKKDNRPQKLMAFSNHSAHIRFERGGKIKPEEIIFDGRRYH